MKILCVLFLFLLLFQSDARGAIRGEEVEYSAGGVNMKGFLAYDDSVSAKRPAVLVVHEWWGHNEYARKRARMLAELGYTALAVDMYGAGKRTTHPEDAEKFVSELMQNEGSAETRFLAAMEVLKQHKTTDANRIAAIGYCFGGGVVLGMARTGVDLDGVASFHGSYRTRTPAQPGKVKAAVLVCHGTADAFSTPEDVAALKKEMEDAKVDFQFIEYEGAKHSFTNPEADEFARNANMPLGYAARADQRSWDDLQKFLKRIFSK